MNEKSGALIGMAMTEKQGGSDVRANVTLAENIEGRIARRVSDHRAQMVLLGSDVRCVSGAGSSAQGIDLFPAAALDTGWANATGFTSSG